MQLATMEQEEQERCLDAAFQTLGHDPGIFEWLSYARAYLPAYRDQPASRDLPL